VAVEVGDHMVEEGEVEDLVVEEVEDQVYS